MQYLDHAGTTPETTARRFRRAQWAVLLATMFCYLFYYTGRQTFGFAIPGIEEELGLKKATLGWISTALLWAYALGQAINGNLGDRFGGRRMVSLGATLSCLLNWVVSFGQNLMSIMVPWAANGYVQAMGWAPGSRVISNWWGHRERGKAYGLYVFSAGMASVLAFGTSLLLVDTLQMNWRWIFRLPVLLMLVGGFVYYLLVRDRPEDRGFLPIADAGAGEEPPGRSDAQPSRPPVADAPRKADNQVLNDAPLPDTTEVAGVCARCGYSVRRESFPTCPECGADLLASGAVMPAQEFEETSWQRYRGVLANPRFMIATLAIGFQSVARYGLLIWVPVYFLGGDWERGPTGAWISIALPVGMALGALSSGWMSDRLFGSNRSRPIALFMLLAAVASMAMFHLPRGHAAGIVLLFLCGFFAYGPQAGFWALCPDLLGKRRAGTGTGVMNTSAYLFAGLGEPFIGEMIDHHDDTAIVFPIVAASCLISATIAAFVRR